MALAGIIVLFLIALATVSASVSATMPTKKNLIFGVSDGFGPASVVFARNYETWLNGYAFNHTLHLDSILVGSSRTRSSSSLVTDSAAGATAFSCALKTYNGAIGVDPDQIPCATILEAAKLAGYTTGLVVTSRITHATPASFVSHVPDRNMEDQIALHEIGNYTFGRMADLMFGGGACHFLPQTSAGSCRADDIDVVARARQGGWTIQTDINDFNTLDENAKLPLMHLFTPDHMSYEIDRDASAEPSLREMVEKAVAILERATRHSTKGYFLLIEGSRIDMAGHTNDAAAHVHEILAYDSVIEFVKQVVDKSTNTMMISVSDHETGGLSVASQANETSYPEYLWKPSALKEVTNSTEVIAAYLIANGLVANQAFVREIALSQWLGINDATTEEMTQIMTTVNQNILAGRLAKLVNTRAQLGWATHGHSAVDVNLYAYGTGSEKLRGNVENTDIGRFMERYLEVDLLQTTAILKRAGALWDTSEQVQQVQGLLHYHNLDVVEDE